MGALFSGGVSAGSAVMGLMGTQKPFVPNIANPYSINTMQPAWMMQQQATDQQAALQLANSNEALYESSLNAEQTARQGITQREAQAQAYDSSGVLLEGSPMMNLEYTRQQVQQQVNMINRAGTVQASMMRLAAYQTLNQGRAQLLGEESQFNSSSNAFNENQAVTQAQAESQYGNNIARAWGSIGSALGSAFRPTYNGNQASSGGVGADPYPAGDWNLPGGGGSQPFGPGDFTIEDF